MARYELLATNDQFDMWRLGQAGGKIHFTNSGKVVFRFDTKQQYEKYLELNNQRGVHS